MRWISALLLFFLAITANAASTTAQPSPQHITSDLVLAHVESVGAKQALADYFAKPEWPAIKEGIASGTGGWLKVYVALDPVADGEAGEDLGKAISDAIPVQPFKVLPILANNGQYKVEQLCTFTFEAETPAGGVNAYLTHLERSLRKASNQSERTLADSCRRGIKVTRNTFVTRSDSDDDRAGREDSLRQALKSWDKSDIATSDRYLVAFRDLNGDGKDEAIVYVIGHDWCGTGGCTTLILVESGTSWKVISRTATTRLPIRILDGTSHGWRSIGVWAQGGGIYPGYEAELRFNGRTYPGGPSASPVKQTKGNVGDVLIPDDEKAAKPLY